MQDDIKDKIMKKRKDSKKGGRQSIMDLLKILGAPSLSDAGSNASISSRSEKGKLHLPVLGVFRVRFMTKRQVYSFEALNYEHLTPSPQNPELSMPDVQS